MRFYIIYHNSFGTRGYPWAFSVIDRSPVEREPCGVCGFTQYYPQGPFDVILEKGTRFPDFLGCAYSFLIVAERVVRALQEAGINEFHPFPVGVAEVRSKKLQGVEAPKYYSLEIDGRCRVDVYASGYTRFERCVGCGRITKTEPSLTAGFALEPGSWDGSHLFRDVDLFPRVPFCTDLVVALAREQRWTNVRFDLMERPLDSPGSGTGCLECHP